MADKQFPEGIRVFKPNEKAPAFVKGEIVLKKSDLTKWLQNQDEEVRLSIKESQKGSYYLEVNTFKPRTEQGKQDKKQHIEDIPSDDLPF